MKQYNRDEKRPRVIAVSMATIFGLLGCQGNANNLNSQQNNKAQQTASNDSDQMMALSLANGYFPDSMVAAGGGSTTGEGCFAIADQSQIATSASTLSTTKMLFDSSAVSDYFGMDASAEASYVGSKMSASVKETTEKSTNAVGSTWVNQYAITNINSISSQNIILTNYGKSLLNNILTNPESDGAYNTFIQSCGTKVVTTTYTGSSVEYDLYLTYNSASDKKTLDTSASFSYGDLASVSASLSTAHSSNGVSTSMRVSTKQQSGAAFPVWHPDSSACSVNSDNSLNSGCTDLQNSFQKFVNDNFGTTTITSPVPIKFPTGVDISSLGIFNDSNINAHFSRLVAQYRANYQYLSSVWADQNYINEIATATTNAGKLSQDNPVYKDLTKTRNISAKNRKLADLILSNACNNGVCPESAVKYYKNNVQSVPALGLAYAYLLDNTPKKSTSGLLFRCSGNSLTVTVKSGEISKVAIGNSEKSISTDKPATFNLDGLCGKTSGKQNYVGYVLLGSESTDYNATNVIPFVLNKDKLFNQFIVTQNLTLQDDHVTSSFINEKVPVDLSTNSQAAALAIELGSSDPDGHTTLPLDINTWVQPQLNLSSSYTKTLPSGENVTTRANVLSDGSIMFDTNFTLYNNQYVVTKINNELAGLDVSKIKNAHNFMLFWNNTDGLSIYKCNDISCKLGGEKVWTMSGSANLANANHLTFNARNGTISVQDINNNNLTAEPIRKNSKYSLLLQQRGNQTTPSLEIKNLNDNTIQDLKDSEFIKAGSLLPEFAIDDSSSSTFYSKNDFKLENGHAILSSIFGSKYHYALVMQPDNNLVLYRCTAPDNTEGNTGCSRGYSVWATATDTKGISNHGYAVLQNLDGNLVVYSDANNTSQSLWGANDHGLSLPAKNDTLKLQDDGDLVIYSEAGSLLFATNTSWK